MKIYNLFLLLLFIGCNQPKIENSEIPVVRVNEKYLYISDIQNLISKNTSPTDSAAFMLNYIGNWVKQELKLQKAIYNLNINKLDIEKQVEDYRNSLIIYAYDKQIVQQQLDTSITDLEVEVYYNVHKSNFELKNNIIKLRFAKTSNLEAIDTIKKYIQSNNEEDLLLLDEYAKKNNVNFYFNDDEWVLFDDLLKQVPINTYNQENYLRNNRYIEFNDQSLYYFVNIIDFKIKNSISPLSYEYDKIKDILINKRKKKLLENLEEKLYLDALKEGVVEIYDGL